MADESPTLEYANWSSQDMRRTRILKLMSLVALILSCLTVLDVTWLETLNYEAGVVLPMAPLPPDARHTWRDPAGSEGVWRARHLNSRLDPEGATRPLSPAEAADFARFQARIQSEINLRSAMLSACLLLPIVGVLLIAIPILIWKNRSRRWRIALAMAYPTQIGVIAVICYRDYLEALSRMFD